MSQEIRLFNVSKVFFGDMNEIASAFEIAGLPPRFQGAAGNDYRRLAHFKEEEFPGLNDVLSALLEKEED